MSKPIHFRIEKIRFWKRKKGIACITDPPLLLSSNFKGLFNFQYDAKTDKVYLEVDELGKEFLYVYSLSSGIGSNDIGLDRGQLGNEQVVYFKKAGNKLLLVQPNLKFRALTENELERKSIEQAFAKSILFGFKIEDEKET